MRELLVLLQWAQKAYLSYHIYAALGRPRMVQQTSAWFAVGRGCACRLYPILRQWLDAPAPGQSLLIRCLNFKLGSILVLYTVYAIRTSPRLSDNISKLVHMQQQLRDLSGEVPAMDGQSGH